MIKALPGLLLGIICATPVTAAAPAAPTVESGFKALDAGNASEAEAILQRVLAAEPRNIGAYEGLVWVYMKMGRPDKAAQMADKRLELAPADTAWQAKRLVILAQVPARREEAIAAYNAWILTHPQELEPRLRLAELLSWAPDRLPEAVTAYRAAVAMAAKDREARLGLARTLSWSGQTREAASIYDVLIMENPADADALLGRAQIASWSGDRATAMRLLDRGMKAHPADGRFFAEAAQVALAGNQSARALDYAKRAVVVSPDLPEARAALAATRKSVAPRVGIRIGSSKESTGFRRDSIGLPIELHPLADTRLRIEPAYEQDKFGSVQLSRPNAGMAVRQSLPAGSYIDAHYRAYFPEGSGSTHAYGAELGLRPWKILELRAGWRQRALLDVPVGYEDVAFLSGVGSGSTTLESVQARVQTKERFVGLNVAPHSGVYLYANATKGDLNDDNGNRSLAAGIGMDVFALAGILPRQSLTLKYDYFYLDFKQTSNTYFSPELFRVHSVGFDFRTHPSESLTLGLEAGLPMRVGGSSGYVAGGFFSWQAGPRLSIDARLRVVDDTQYRVTSFTFGPRISF